MTHISEGVGLGEDTGGCVAFSFFGGDVVGFERCVSMRGDRKSISRRGIHTRTVGAEEEFPLAVNGRVEKGLSVLGAFGRGFAVVILNSEIHWLVT